jgi:hypothetical protein
MIFCGELVLIQLPGPVVLYGSGFALLLRQQVQCSESNKEKKETYEPERYIDVIQMAPVQILYDGNQCKYRCGDKL